MRGRGRRSASPRHGIRHVRLGEGQLCQFGAQGIAALDAYRRQDDLTVAGLDFKIVRSPYRLGHGLGQRQLVLAGELGKHDEPAYHSRKNKLRDASEMTLCTCSSSRRLKRSRSSGGTKPVSALLKSCGRLAKLV